MATTALGPGRKVTCDQFAGSDKDSVSWGRSGPLNARFTGFQPSHLGACLQRAETRKLANQRPRSPSIVRERPRLASLTSPRRRVASHAECVSVTVRDAIPPAATKKFGTGPNCASADLPPLNRLENPRPYCYH